MLDCGSSFQSIVLPVITRLFTPKYTALVQVQAGKTPDVRKKVVPTNSVTNVFLFMSAYYERVWQIYGYGGSIVFLKCVVGPFSRWSIDAIEFILSEGAYHFHATPGAVKFEPETMFVVIEI